MKIYNNPSPETWAAIAERPQLSLEFLESAVKNILNRVRKSGDAGIRELTLQFDKTQVDQLLVSKEEIKEADQKLSAELKQAIQTAAANIEKFHAAQKRESVKI